VGRQQHQYVDEQFVPDSRGHDQLDQHVLSRSFKFAVIPNPNAWLENRLGQLFSEMEKIGEACQAAV
jgi:hypothetical protein